MKIIPCNRRLVVAKESTADVATENPVFLLPADYSSKEEEYEVYKFVSADEGCLNKYHEGDLVAVEQHLVETMNISGEEILLVQETAVVCIIRNE